MTQDAAKVVAFAQRIPEVTKISLGIIKPGGVSRGLTLKITDEPACLRISVRGSDAFQELRLYATDKQAVREALATTFK
jgi:hypothetical protein